MQAVFKYKEGCSKRRWADISDFEEVISPWRERIVFIIFITASKVPSLELGHMVSMGYSAITMLFAFKGKCGNF